MRDDYRFLPFFLREPVYVVDDRKTLPVESRAPLLPVTGLGKKGVLLLVREPQHPFLSPADQALLEKILPAVSLSADDISLVNWHPVQADLRGGQALDQYLPAQNHQTIIVFGEVPQPWSQSNFFEEYAVKSNETQRFLQTNSLDTLNQDSVQKLRFWKCLQQLFPQR